MVSLKFTGTHIWFCVYLWYLLLLFLPPLFVDAELVDGIEHVWLITRTIDLLAAPLGVVDAVNPVFHLHNNTSVLGNGAGELGVVKETLGLLEGHSAVLAVARV